MLLAVLVVVVVGLVGICFPLEVKGESCDILLPESATELQIVQAIIDRVSYINLNSYDSQTQFEISAMTKKWVGMVGKGIVDSGKLLDGSEKELTDISLEMADIMILTPDLKKTDFECAKMLVDYIVDKH